MSASFLARGAMSFRPFPRATRVVTAAPKTLPPVSASSPMLLSRNAPPVQQVRAGLTNSQRLALIAQEREGGGGEGQGGRYSHVRRDVAFALGVVLASFGIAMATVDEDELAEQAAELEARFAAAGVKMPRGEEDGHARASLVRYLAKQNPDALEGLMAMSVAQLTVLFASGSAVEGLVDVMSAGNAKKGTDMQMRGEMIAHLRPAMGEAFRGVRDHVSGQIAASVRDGSHDFSGRVARNLDEPL
ncbi:MAG: hypothetical protein JJT89_08800 [Nitriliruptoraceae bacterium]|nr:hypothetical protein [Nitriliruptoraceae bacterium]